MARTPSSTGLSRTHLGWAALMLGVGGLAIYATAPRVSRPALANVAAIAFDEEVDDLLPPEGSADYSTRRLALADAQEALAARHEAGEPVLDLAQEALSDHLGPMIESWVGTPYGFFGMSDEPGAGSIACGFFVSTVLQHAGFDVRRIELGRQPSEHIVQTLVSEEHIERFDHAQPTTVVRSAVEQGAGIYLVGLDTHTGFLVHDARSVRFCHATSRSAQAVVCEPARESRSLRSDYTVMGKLGDEAAMAAWLEGRTLATVRD
ncbi:MAG: hypothetical protein AAF602_18250 [Myxococcota bacterium]